MIRFLDLSNQIEEDQINFAYFDTVSMTILIIGGEQVFNSWQEVEEVYKRGLHVGSRVTLDRLKSITPEQFL